jgi:hypothetical protein
VNRKWNNHLLQNQFFFYKSFFFRSLRTLKMSVLLFSMFEQENFNEYTFLLNSFWDTEKFPNSLKKLLLASVNSKISCKKYFKNLENLEIPILMLE